MICSTVILTFTCMLSMWLCQLQLIQLCVWSSCMHSWCTHHYNGARAGVAGSPKEMRDITWCNNCPTLWFDDVVLSKLPQQENHFLAYEVCGEGYPCADSKAWNAERKAKQMTPWSTRHWGFTRQLSVIKQGPLLHTQGGCFAQAKYKHDPLTPVPSSWLLSLTTAHPTPWTSCSGPEGWVLLCHSHTHWWHWASHLFATETQRLWAVSHFFSTKRLTSKLNMTAHLCQLRLRHFFFKPCLWNLFL